MPLATALAAALAPRFLAFSSVCPVRTQARYSAATSCTSGNSPLQWRLSSLTRWKPLSARTSAQWLAFSDAGSAVTR